MPSPSVRVHGRAVGPLACLALVLTVASPALAQGPLRSISGLTEVAVYEATSIVNRVPYAPAAAQLLSRLADPLNNANRDFSFFNGENYDVFYSDDQGVPDPFGVFLTIEATWTGSASDGSMNITGAELVINGQRLLATTVASIRTGSRCIPAGCVPSSAQRAVDGDLSFNTIPRLGATDPNVPTDRIRLTLGFPRPTGTTLTLAPVSQAAPGGTLTFSWNSIGAAAYTLGITGGPGIATPLVVGSFACCGTSLQVPANAAPGTYRVAVSADNVVSAAVDVAIQSSAAAPVLAPVAPVGAGGLLTFIWTPNAGVLYDLVVLSGPGVSAPMLVGQAACCVITLPIDGTVPPGTYQAMIRGAGVPSNTVSIQILGSSQPLELAVTSTIIRPGLQTTLSWTDRGVQAGPFYDVFVGAAGAASLSLVATQQCCVLAVPWGSAPVGSYDVYVQDSNGVRSNRVTIRFDP